MSTYVVDIRGAMGVAAGDDQTKLEAALRAARAELQIAVREFSRLVQVLPSPHWYAVFEASR